MAKLSRLGNAAEGTIFYYFNTKDYLLGAVLESVRNVIIETFRRAGRDKNSFSGIDRIEVLPTFYLHQTVHMQEDADSQE